MDFNQGVITPLQEKLITDFSEVFQMIDPPTPGTDLNRTLIVLEFREGYVGPYRDFIQRIQFCYVNGDRSPLPDSFKAWLVSKEWRPLL